MNRKPIIVHKRKNEYIKRLEIYYNTISDHIAFSLMKASSEHAINKSEEARYNFFCNNIFLIISF